jgi:23S rRNA-/tRNA-specific pseudouridylate synthase
MPPAPAHIGFPPPLLGHAPVRLPVLAGEPGLLALAKPAGIAWEAEDAAVLDALRAQLDAAKPELAPFALVRPASVWPLETETAGPGLLVSRDGPLDPWRNAFGSGLLRFTYILLAQDTSTAAAHGPAAAADTFTCDLPVALHTNPRVPRALISAATGKKSRTHFRRIFRAGPWAWWEAETDYPRFHQVRLHAAESGLLIAGETLYAHGPAPTLEQFLPKHRVNKGTAAPLVDGVCLRLARVDFSRAGLAIAGLTELDAPEPPKWAVLRKRLQSVF